MGLLESLGEVRLVSSVLQIDRSFVKRSLLSHVLACVSPDYRLIKIEILVAAKLLRNCEIP